MRGSWTPVAVEGSATMGSVGEINMSSTFAVSASALSKAAFAILVILTIRITAGKKMATGNHLSFNNSTG